MHYVLNYAKYDTIIVYVIFRLSFMKKLIILIYKLKKLLKLLRYVFIKMTKFIFRNEYNILYVFVFLFFVFYLNKLIRRFWITASFAPLALLWSCPFLNVTKVGNDVILHNCDISGTLSTFALTNLTLENCDCELNELKVGAICLQGPHQSAKKSTIT